MLATPSGAPCETHRAKKCFNGRLPSATLSRLAACACGNALTGGSVTNRTGKRYPYNCQNKKCHSKVSVPKEALEKHFVDFLQQLRPNPKYLKLFRESATLVYKHKFEEFLDSRQRLERELRMTKGKKRSLNEAFIYHHGTLSLEDYTEMKQSLEQDILALELRSMDAKSEEVEIEALLDYGQPAHRPCRNMATKFVDCQTTIAVGSVPREGELRTR